MWKGEKRVKKLKKRRIKNKCWTLEKLKENLWCELFLKSQLKRFNFIYLKTQEYHTEKINMQKTLCAFLLSAWKLLKNLQKNREKIYEMEAIKFPITIFAFCQFMLGKYMKNNMISVIFFLETCITCIKYACLILHNKV